MKEKRAPHSLLVLAICLSVGTYALNYIGKRNFLTGDWYNRDAFYWLVEDKGEAKTSYHFGPGNDAFELSVGQSQPVYNQSQPVYKKYHLDVKNHTLSISNPYDDFDIIQGKYSVVNDHIIEWLDEKTKRNIRLTKHRIKGSDNLWKDIR